MPRTKPIYIYPSDSSYKNLLEELTDIHTRLNAGSVDDVRAALEALSKEVGRIDTTTSAADADIKKHIDDAKGVYDSIDDRFLALDQYDILNTLQRISTTKQYEYADGKVSKVQVRGDMNYDIEYGYDSYDRKIREIKKDLNGNIISEKYYDYDANGELTNVRGRNTDDVMMVSNSLITHELDERLKNIEAIDFVKLSQTMGEWDLIHVAKTVQELVTAVQHLMLNLPENIPYLIDTSEVFRRLDDIETRIDAAEVYRSFDVISTKQEYDIPDELVDKKFGVYMEGLLLEKGVDYVINDNKIKFLIPLIDDFTVSYKS